MEIQKALNYLRKSDSRMGRLIDEYGPPEFNPINNYYESLVRSIVYQQLSGKAASTIFGRFKNLFNSKSFPKSKDVLFALHIFPHQTVDGLVVKQSLEHVQEANLEFSFKKCICQ